MKSLILLENADCITPSGNQLQRDGDLVENYEIVF